MINYIIGVLEKWGTFAGWTTAIVQIPIWLIGAIFLYFRERKRKGEFDALVQEKNYWNEEYHKKIDLANAWHQIAKEELSIMKHNAPEAYKKFVESYGGEDKFQEWWQLPDIPMIEDKEERDM